MTWSPRQRQELELRARAHQAYVARVVRDELLGPGLRHYLLTMAAAAGWTPNRRLCVGIEQARIGELMGLSPRTIWERQNEAEEAGWVEVVRRHRKANLVYLLERTADQEG